MKVNEVSIFYKRSIQMRQFAPAEVSVSIKAQVDAGEKPEQVIKKIKEVARSQVDKEFEVLKRERLESLDDPLEKSA